MIAKLSIIIPVYNEENTIFPLLNIVDKVVLNNSIQKEVIIVNDSSSDQSLAEINRFLAENEHQSHSTFKLVKNDKNLGKGGSIQQGIKHATGEYTIVQDADLELVPEEFNILLEPVLKDEADIVYGSRFLDDKGLLKNESMANHVANKVLTQLGNVINGTKLTDMQTCYKLVPTELFKNLGLKESRFAFDPEITARLAKHKSLRWTEVPITYNPRKQSDGKKIGYMDGVRAVYAIVRYGLFK